MVIIRELNNTLLIAVNSDLIKCDLIGDENNGKTCVEKLPQVILPENITKGQEEILKSESKSITSFAISKNSEFIALGTNNKQVVVYQLSIKNSNTSFNVVKNFILNRASSKLCFSPDNSKLIVADKTGDCFIYDISINLNNENENNSGKCILGHNSMLLDVLISDDGKYIITCDRDEKIRVSCFPNAYNIVSYCLGHEEFVTHIFILEENVLLSASGDGTLRTWNYLEGKQLCIANTNQHIQNTEPITKFTSEMDGDNVEIKALPITDVQVNLKNKHIAVSLLNVPAVQLYTFNKQLIKFVSNVKLDSLVINYCLGEFNLYVLLNDTFICYDIKEMRFKDSEVLGKVYKENKDVLSKPFCSTEISILYKRKFDNVQEYLERKKQRLENK